MPQVKSKREECSHCGSELPAWRARHTDKCIKCGMARCRSCGQSVENMEYTANGGECQACNPPHRFG